MKIMPALPAGMTVEEVRAANLRELIRRQRAALDEMEATIGRDTSPGGLVRDLAREGAKFIPSPPPDDLK